MAKNKRKKAKVAKKSKPAKSKAKSKKKKAPAKSARSKKKAAPKKAARKKVTKKKPVAKKAPAKKAAVKKKVVKKAPGKKIQAKKAVQKAKPAPKKPAAPKPIVHARPAGHTKVEAHTEKKAHAEAAAVQQQEAHGGEHKESFTPHITHLKAGDPAPDFSGIDQNGHRVALDDFKEKTLVLYFYPKDDTDGCTAESCSLRDEYSYMTSQNHAVVGVSADDVESHKKFADKFSLPFPLLADTSMEIIHAYDVWGKKRLFDHIYDGIVRTTFIIKDGTIQRVITSVNTKHHGKQVMEA